MSTATIHKQRRSFTDPIAAPKPHPRFEPPPLTNLQNLKLPLHAIDAALEARVESKMVFHMVGDTGGVHGTEVQEAIAEHMESQFQSAPDDPAFYYNLGDVVYFNGLNRHYNEQFYEPYQHYPARIFAIPGNHDGDTQVRPGDEPDPEPTLKGFVTNFCDSQPHYLSAYRPTMTQPYVYWTLDTPLATIIGLYSNVDGLLDGRGTFEQQRWLQNELADADKSKWLIVTVHHPCYSLDKTHGGYKEIGDALDRAFAAADRYPHAVFSGHVHNYQRFSRELNGREVPYVVAGAGGYAHNERTMHKMQTDPKTGKHLSKKHSTTVSGVKLVSYNDQDPGFLRITITANELTGEYFVVPFDGAPPADHFDTFTVSRP